MAVKWTTLYEHEGALETVTMMAAQGEGLTAAALELVADTEQDAHTYLAELGSANGPREIAHRNIGRVSALRAMGVIPEPAEPSVQG